MHAKTLLAYSETNLYIYSHSKSPLSPGTLKDFSHILQIRLNTFGVFAGYDKTLLAYSRNSHKELRIAETKMHSQQGLMTLKGQYFGKIE
jgi:hypothetical protein